MHTLSNLTNESRPAKKRKLLGRGPGCKHGKTCGRGHKGDGSRAGYKRRWGREGGQMRLHMKLPQRGFSNFEFRNKFATINLSMIDNCYSDGEVVNLDSLIEKGLVHARETQVKILGEGNITKKLSFEVQAITSGAREKLQKANLSFTLES